jgi:hypothetical protein
MINDNWSDFDETESDNLVPAPPAADGEGYDRRWAAPPCSSFAA